MRLFQLYVFVYFLFLNKAAVKEKLEQKIIIKVWLVLL